MIYLLTPKSRDFRVATCAVYHQSIFIIVILFAKTNVLTYCQMKSPFRINAYFNYSTKIIVN